MTSLVWMVVPALCAAAPQKKDDFASFLEGVRKEAKAQGISDETLKVLDGLEPIPGVVERDRKQPESTMTFARFLELLLTQQRVDDGRRLLAEHRALVDAASKKYGVPSEIIVALWGVETKYGAVMGDFSIVGALATLGHDGRRAKFFRKQLFHALKILDEGHIDAASFKGSWAGAMGQCQFMPSTFTAYAADGDGDGKRDIWSNKADVFASAANYLKKIRWDKRTRWGREVKLPEKFDHSVVGLDKEPRTIAEWRKLGVTTADGGELPNEIAKAWLVRPDGQQGTAVLAYPNFKVIMRWNRSQYFAATVGMLSDRIAAPLAQAQDVK